MTRAPGLRCANFVESAYHASSASTSRAPSQNDQTSPHDQHHMLRLSSDGGALSRSRQCARVSQRRTAIAFSIIAALVFVGCRDALVAPTFDADHAIPVSSVDELLDTVTDLTDRVIPALPASTSTRQLAARLDALAHAVRSRSRRDAQHALDAARTSADSIAVILRSDDEALAELDVVRLELDVVEERLRATDGDGV